MASSETQLRASNFDIQDRDKQSQTHARFTAYPNNTLDIQSLVEELVLAVEDSIQTRKLGVMFRNLRVIGLDARTSVQHNLASMFYPRSIMKFIQNLHHPPVRDIISGFDGVVCPGEMLHAQTPLSVVLGRPGSGCSTFLKILANHRGEYHNVLGDVFYDSFTSEEIEKRYRGDAIYCPEDDVHFPTLTVQQTIEFASTMRTPSGRADNQSKRVSASHTTELLLRLFGLQGAKDTIVGNSFLRGISGGEKKRVSIAEVMSARGKIVCWDNSTRGLDSSTALDFIRILRAVTGIANVATVVSIYQAGEQLFELFDKVCVIYDGKMAYFGPATEAKQYFMNMGYEPRNRQTTSDFLVATTDPNARKIRPGFQSTVPRTADEMAAYFRTSVHGQLNRSSMDSHYSLFVNKPELKKAYEMSAISEHARHALQSSPYILSILMQVRAVVWRRLQILKGDRITLAVQVGLQILLALFVGTEFLQLGSTTNAYSSRVAVFFIFLFCDCTLSLVELPSLFSQRLIVIRHQKGALYHPFIEALAHTIADVPVSFIAVTIKAIILYFLVGFQRTTEQFFIFLLFIFITTLLLKSCIRCIAAFCPGISIALPTVCVALLFMILYSGYVIPIKDITGALKWLSYANPLRYVLESLVVNEFRTLDGTCALLVPSGPGYENVTLTNQVCDVVGSKSSMTTVPGEAYAYASFGYFYSNLWKNLGILCIFGFGFLGSLLLSVQFNKQTAQDTTVTLYTEGSVLVPVHKVPDEENISSSHSHERRDLVNVTDKSIVECDRTNQVETFSWNKVSYDIRASGVDMRRLLDDVCGYITPGKLIALMGGSGAGKTVLLDVLANRISGGIVRGDYLVNGYPLPANFASQTAYVQQLDTHNPESTVREALLFSARLRQPTSVPMAEKEAYVDKCLRICGLEAYADAIVGSLDVEHRKRTTIGVELAAKPRLLLFLDEPTSGLDSQSAWALVKVLRQLADSGLAIICAIHQPSGELFQLFDQLLLLQKGGKTVYFGDIGDKSMTMIEYFQRNGAAQCAADANPAEYMLDVIGTGATATSMTDWSHIWENSPEAIQLNLKLESILRGQSRPVMASGSHSEIASSWMKQLTLVTYCGFVSYWRNPALVCSKLFACVFIGLLVGFSYFGAANSLQGFQDKTFSLLLALIMSILTTQQSQTKFIEHRIIYEVREYPSRIYTWTAFLVSQSLIEISFNILAIPLFFVCWYWSSGFDNSRVGFFYLFYCIVFPLYYTTLALAVAVVSPNAIIASAVFITMTCFTASFAGVLEPYRLLGRWKWMYYLSPLTYIIEGLLGQVAGNQLITCTSTELVILEPASGMNCGAYMDRFISSTGGYLTNPDATAQCSFCPVRASNEFLQASFNISYGHHWRDLFITLGFVAFNVLLLFAGMFFRINRGIGLKNMLDKTN